MISEYQRKTGYRVHDPRMVRLRSTATRKFLHLSGSGETDGETYAWLGYRHQADTLRARAEIRGEAWPYEVEA